ncbi:MAG: hypothetical protein J6Y90_00405 [Lachnospiraceae bacterium]|nr:hypothetical protein [Lachnospiraceae bacterium]
MNDSELLHEARLIILACEYSKRDSDGEVSKAFSELTAYYKLKELLIKEDENI